MNPAAAVRTASRPGVLRLRSVDAKCETTGAEPELTVSLSGTEIERPSPRSTCSKKKPPGFETGRLRGGRRAKQTKRRPSIALTGRNGGIPVAAAIGYLFGLLASLDGLDAGIGLVVAGESNPRALHVLGGSLGLSQRLDIALDLFVISA